MKRLLAQPGGQSVIIVLFAAVLFMPFSGKPFHIDSPVTIYIAEQLLENPLDPPAGEFGPLLAPWNHTELPPSSAFHATPHPPLISFYTAGIIKLFGSGEKAVNRAFFPFYAGTLLFFFGLCIRFGIRNRMPAALLFAVSPVLFINAQNVMYDVPLAMFCAGSFFCMFRSGSVSDAFLAGLFAGCACLVKFTAGTMLIAGTVYFIARKDWRSLLVFLGASGGLNLLWLLHNLHFFHAWQLTQNGHARYIPGDLRYRLERMAAYIGGGYTLPLFPLAVWWLSKKLRLQGILFGGITLLWSVLLYLFLHYSIPAACFYWLCAFAGGLIVMHLYSPAVIRPAPGTAKDSTGLRRKVTAPTMLAPEYAVLALHTLLQIIGGVFLTLYVVRYTLSFIFIPILFFIRTLETTLASQQQRRFWRIALPVTLALSLMLSVSDYLIVNAEKRIADDVTRRYPKTNVFYKGRLGYLYYMHKAGCSSLTAQKPLKQGDLVVENCFYRDDVDFFNANRTSLHLIDSCTYPLFPLCTIGGRAGFYGNDRLPYALNTFNNCRKFRLYRFTK